jgi:hypothetical protein
MKTISATGTTDVSGSCRVVRPRWPFSSSDMSGVETERDMEDDLLVRKPFCRDLSVPERDSNPEKGLLGS